MVIDEASEIKTAESENLATSSASSESTPALEKQFVPKFAEALTTNRIAQLTKSSIEEAVGSDVFLSMANSRREIAEVNEWGVVFTDGEQRDSRLYVCLNNPREVKRSGQRQVFFFEHQGEPLLYVKQKLSDKVNIHAIISGNLNQPPFKTTYFRNIVLEKDGGQCLDLTKMLDDNWKWEFRWHWGNGYLSGDFFAKPHKGEIGLGNIFTTDVTEGMFVLLHEFGHAVYDFSNPEELEEFFPLMEKRREEERIKSRIKREKEDGQEKSLTKKEQESFLTDEERERLVFLQSKSERGAYAIALQTYLRLKHAGFDLGVSYKRSHEHLVYGKLLFYSREYGTARLDFKV